MEIWHFIVYGTNETEYGALGGAKSSAGVIDL